MNKWRAKRVRLDGYVFGSIKESKHYLILKELAKKGLIQSLEIHPSYEITVNKVKICTYIADFSYYTDDGKYVVEDVKGSKATITPVFKLKKKLMKAVHKINVVEVI